LCAKQVGSVARAYRKRAVFLAGDAAHLNNPLGGMGLNGGLQDVPSFGRPRRLGSSHEVLNLPTEHCMSADKNMERLVLKMQIKRDEVGEVGEGRSFEALSRGP
jgi:3-(3-hydroxy-phenyl)propionate hydroxylase